jgi:lysophospholipase L1-like esterase
MSTESHTNRSMWRIALLAGALVAGGCDAVNELVDEIDDIGNDAEVHYYLSLGTSLSVGVQPNSSGTLFPTDDGYPDQLFDTIRPAFDAGGAQPRELRLNKLGCPGETLKDLVDGGSCPYIAGSQLDAAVDFLADNAGRVHLVTIDMGANDFRNAGCIGATVDFDCVDAVSLKIATDLAAVLTALRDAAGPDTTIVGMNYYNPYLASWLEGAAGEALAVESAQAVAVVTGFLQETYATAGIPVADVAAAFRSDDFTNMAPAPNEHLPVNVANICEFTYMCDADPVGPDIHANDAGYALIASAFADILP